MEEGQRFDGAQLSVEARGGEEGFDGRSLTSEAFRKWNGVVSDDSKNNPSMDGCPSLQ